MKSNLKIGRPMQIGLVVAAFFLVVALAFHLMKSDQAQPGKVNSVESIGEVIADKTKESKLEAYDAMANEKTAFYNRQAAVFQKESRSSTPAAKPAPAPAAVATQYVPDVQFDAAYQEVEQNVRQMYETPASSSPTVTENSVTPTDPQVVVQDRVAIESPEERRRKALMQGWGQVKQENIAGDSITSSAPPMFQGVIHGTQVIKSGQCATFRTKEPIRYGKLLVPTNTLLYGYTSVTENRLTVKINSVQLGHTVFALPLEIYGSDGIPGIPLNYDEVGKIANSQTTAAALRETSSAMSTYGGTLGRVVGAVASGVGNQVRSAKSRDITLIDNQVVILKIKER